MSALYSDVETPTELLQRGCELLTRGAWEEARSVLEEALQREESPAALEAMGLAAWGLNDAAMIFHTRERAYELYRRADDRRGAARTAACLAMDHFYFRGEHAIAVGWLQRGRRLVEDLDACPEQGWLAVAEAQIAMWTDHDFVRAQQLCGRAVSLGKLLGDLDLEMVALAGKGLSLVSRGKIRKGMRCLDEATMAAVSGEMTDVDAACTACCCLLYACEWTRDYQRAQQWIGRMKDLAVQWSHPTLIAFCRIHYATLLIWQGSWAEAERELIDATNKLEETQPALAAEGFVRLAELRCKQGRLDEASALLERAEAPPFRVLAGHMYLCGRAAIAFAEGDAEVAVDLAERFLRALPEEDRMERVTGLELLVEALIACEELERVEDVLSELHTIATRVDTPPMHASVHFAGGMLAAAMGQHDKAKRCFEDAVDLWSRTGAPFETARARVGLAQSLFALGRVEAGREQARKAFEAFEQLGAVAAAAHAEAVTQKTETTPTGVHESTRLDNLTAREQEILRLVITGRSNQEIADLLFLSVRTVERHLSNLYQKIGVSGKSARAAAVAYALKNGMA